MDDRPAFVVACLACLETVPRERAIWKPLVSKATGLYYPGEPFCGENCYDRWTTQENSDYLQPTDDQKLAFRRTCEPMIPQVATAPFVVKRRPPPLPPGVPEPDFTTVEAPAEP